MSFRLAGKKLWIFSFLAEALLAVSCASAPKTVLSKEVHDTYEPEDSGIAIAVDNTGQKKNKDYPFFFKIDQQIMNLIENGSPDSLKKAYMEIKAIDDTSEDQIKILYYIEASIMQMVWPSERFDVEVPALSSQNAYSGAINSAREQIYDMSTGNGDFLAVVLPSLVVTQTSDVSSFFADSQSALKKALEKAPDSVLVNYLLGVLYSKHGEPKKALGFFERAWRGAAENKETNLAYLTCLYECDRYAEANSLLGTAMIRFPQEISFNKLKARVAFAAGDYVTAEDNINRVLQKDPNDLVSFLFRARILVEKEDYIHAASLLDVYARQDSSSKEYLLLRSRLQLDWSHNIPAVMETVSQALANYPGDKDVLLFAAKVSNVTGMDINGKSADEYAEAVLAKSPGDREGVQYAIEGLVRRKMWDKAYGYSSAFVKQDNISREMLLKHIEICLALGKNDEAWNTVLPIYKKEAKNEDVLQAYINVLSSIGKTSEAMSLINELLSSAPSKMKSYLHYRRSILQSRESDKLSDLRSSIIAYPRNSDALFSLYEVYYKKQDYRKAQYYLKQVVALRPNDAEIISLNEKLSAYLK